MKLSMIATGTVMGLLVAGNALAAEGKDVYAKNCGVCHGSLPPKLGDKKAWAPRIQKGTDALVASVVKGLGAMPPKGGKPALSDADIRAAVEYMVSRAQ